VKNQEIINSINKRQRESIAARLLKEGTLDSQNRPSIETLLHSLLLKYTLHTHSVAVNMIVVQDNCKAILKTIFEDDTIAFVEYETPGIELAIALGREIDQFEATPKIIILQNHGLIITSEEKDEIKSLTENVLEKIETYLNLDMSRYKLTNDISSLFDRIEDNSNISYLSDDKFLNEQLKKNKNLFLNTPFCPDTFVYCSTKALEINNVSDSDSIKDYKERHRELPKVILYKENLFFIASSLKKAKEMEEVLKFHIMVLKQNQDKKLNFLAAEELDYLSNWEAEKYRQKL
jgi:rhamnose utilization protein RhaD (predicted bifunctional aldolase and dehydrogenase)